ncbi:alpha/beta fold hydrolase [Sporosalibacterium faouarense]|uniref:alpha/beta fold hydrolase n=1 Tax=Sporosalibacterium faouarense TaxID=516123 RepID=UPI00141CC5C2|nr:alpha/beta fold hydrolase [Sporosalibacterium faouarense]MTI47918.1 alpha/beta fold hydrolase [Bacillota bacterium]
MTKTFHVKKLENRENYIILNGIKHWYKIAGAENETIPIVIIHGGPGGNNYVFERTIGPLLEKFSTVIYYEQRGCGRSGAPKNKDAYSMKLLAFDLAVLCNELGLNKIIPLGFSFGGELALVFTILYPNLVDKVIAQAPSLFSDYKRISFIQSYGFLQIAKGDFKKRIVDIMSSDIDIEEKCSEIWDNADTETVDRFLFHNSKYAKINRDLWKQSELLNTGLMMKALLKEKNEFYMMDKLEEIDVPSLIITGIYDRNVGLDLNRDIASKINNSKFVIFDKSAHFPDIEETTKYAEVIRNFIKD